MEGGGILRVEVRCSRGMLLRRGTGGMDIGIGFGGMDIGTGFVLWAWLMSEGCL